VGGCVGVVFGVRENKAYALDGFAVYDTEAVATAIMKYKNKEIIVYPDATGAKSTSNSSKSDIDILRGHGLNINAPKANGAVRDRINSVNRLFAQDRLYINDRIEKLSYALQTQAYKDNGKPEKWDEHKGGAIDDWNDALGYFIVRKFGLRDNMVKKIKVSHA